VFNHIQSSCGIDSIGPPTIIYEDNVACVAQMQPGYVKSNFTKHITPKLFYPHELQESGVISMMQIKSCNNLTNLFTKSLSYTTFSKCVVGIGMYRLKDLQELGARFFIKPLDISHHIALFFLCEFCYKVLSQ
jgi:hypothetical protein